MPVQLIVNADDYGLTAGASAGIRDSHLRGIVTSTTTMMNFPNAEDALRRSMVECPNLGLGVHLVLTGGAPLLPAASVPSLVNEQQRFYGEAAFIARLNQVNVEEVRAEWRTQIEKFVAIMGHAPDHLDSHHHSSYFTPDLFRVMLQLAREYGCAIRLPTGKTEADVLAGLPKLQPGDPALKQYVALLAEYQPRHPNWFNLDFYDDGATAENLSSILANLGDGVTELMCHPAQVDDDLRKVSIYIEQRGIESGLLTQPVLLEQIRENDIELITFGRLA